MGFKAIELKGKFIIKAKLRLLTGLHIGTSGNTLDIGGVDNPVIKDSYGKPYIPGSSLKGKLRCLAEFYFGLLKPGSVVYTKQSNDDGSIRMHMCGEENCLVCGLFGRNHGNHEVIEKNDQKESVGKSFDESIVPTRLIVRDAHLIDESITEEMKDNMDLEYTEVKFENSLDRITSAANPRQTERVPANAAFECNFVVNVFNDDKKKYLETLIEAMKLLEDDYLGGQGSRGYGRVKFEGIEIEYRDKDYYSGKGTDEKKKINAESLCKIELDQLKIE